MDTKFQQVYNILGRLTALFLMFKVVTKALNASRIYLLPSFTDFSKFGKWSVVTGCTEGIGKAIANVLASNGQNIVLVSRNEEKLKKEATEIELKHGVKTKLVAIDFTEDESIYKKLEEALHGIDVGVLVNNVGMMLPLESFLDTPNLSTSIRDIMKVNVMSVCKMTQLVLPGMVKRKRGLIINMSSVSAIKPAVNFALYGATKAFIDYLSQTLSYEYEHKGIYIQSILPSFVSTNSTSQMPVNLFVRPVDSFASSLLATVGKDRMSHGCWQHALQAWGTELVPEKFYHFVLRSQMENFRKYIN